MTNRRLISHNEANPGDAMVSTNGHTILRFGDFELDTGRRLLHTLDGDVIPLTARVYDTLVCLVGRPGELVDKREILDAVWPHVVVEENNLTQAISTLRRALGEAPREHRYIATVPGRGYRFVARVEHVSPSPTAGDARIPERTLESPSPNHRRIAMLGAVAAIIIAATVGSRYITSPGVTVSGNRAALTNQTLLTERDASHRQPTLSPDGSLVAYVSDETGTDQIYVQNIADGGPHQITDIEGGAEHPSWSPNNDRIIFHRLAHGGIWSVGTLGDPPPRLLIEEGRNPVFSFDGSAIVYERDQEIRITDRDGAFQRAVSGFLADETTDIELHPTPSPDGEEIVFFQSEVGPIGDYWVLPIAGGDIRRLTSDRTEGGRPAWSTDGYIYFPSEREGTRTIWRVAEDGGIPQPVTNSTGSDEDPAVSRDGSKLVYANARLETRFMVRDTISGIQEEVYRSHAKSSFPKVSHDREHVAFFQKSDPEEQLFLMDVDDWDAIQLTFARYGERRIMPRWSHDDATIYFYEVPADSDAQALRALPVSGGPSRDVFSEFAWLMNMDVEWDPGGGRIAFVRRDPLNNLASESAQVVIRHLDSGREIVRDWPIVYGPGWSTDGRFILGASENAVLVCAVAGNECRTVFAGLQVHTNGAIGGLGLYAQWSTDGSRIFFNRRTSRVGILELWAVDRDGHDAQRLFEYGPVDLLDGRFQVLDGDRILWNELVPSLRSELWSATLTRSDNEP